MLASNVAVCWGANESRQLDVDGDPSRAAPETVDGLGDVDRIAAGYDHSCATAGDSLSCWGGNLLGQLGNGDSSDNPAASPVDVQDFPADTAPVDVSGGWYSTAIIDTEGTPWGGETTSTRSSSHRTTPGNSRRPQSS